MRDPTLRAGGIDPGGFFFLGYGSSRALGTLPQIGTRPTACCAARIRVALCTETSLIKFMELLLFRNRYYAECTINVG